MLGSTPELRFFIGWALPTKETVFGIWSDVAATMIRAYASFSPCGRCRGEGLKKRIVRPQEV